MWLCIKMKKAQIRMTETIAVLFIFFILVVLGIVFYYRYQQVSLKEQQEELLAARAMDTTLRVLFLPELLCTKGNAEPEDNCFDVLKLKNADFSSSYYFNLFSYANITVYKIYPGEEEKAYYLYDKQPTARKDDGTFAPSWQRKEPTYFVVTLRNELGDVAGQTEYGFGYVKVEVYS